MVCFILKTLTCGSLLTLSLAIPNFKVATTHQNLSKRATNNSSPALPPSKDPWYSAPENFEVAEPGAILRLRVAPGNTASAVNASTAYNILYRTTDSNYEAAWAVTTLYIPESNSSKSNYLLSYQYAYDSANIDEGPSYTFQTGPPPDISNALSVGWYVNVPDYEGPLSSFALGVQAGHATLDAVRAVLSSGFGLAEDVQYALWGYSGGALASEWAAELQEQYAPELDISGVALGGLTPNLSNTLSQVSGTLIAALLVEGLVGATTQDPDAREFLINQLKTDGPYNATKFMSVQNITFAEAEETFALQDISNYFVGGEPTLSNPILERLYNTQGVMGYHGIPRIPLFAYKAIADETSPVGDTDELIDHYCQVGANILYQRNSVGGHLDENTNGDARAFKWLGSVLSGTYNNTGCLIQNVTINITDTGL